MSNRLRESAAGALCGSQRNPSRRTLDPSSLFSPSFALVAMTGNKGGLDCRVHGSGTLSLQKDVFISWGGRPLQTRRSHPPGRW
jgi:hypothetical protein